MCRFFLSTARAGETPATPLMSHILPLDISWPIFSLPGRWKERSILHVALKKSVVHTRRYYEIFLSNDNKL